MDWKPDLSPEQKLDIVLQHVVNWSQEDPQTYMFIANSIGANAYWKEVFEILLKLRSDGHITSINESGYGTYVSNFDGRLFIDQGGYQAKALKDAADAEEQQLEIARLRSFDVSNDKNQRQLNTLTNRLSWATWFAFGAAIALLLWQIYSYYHAAPVPIHVKIQTEKSFNLSNGLTHI